MNIQIPDGLRIDLRRQYGDVAADWLSALPTLVTDVCHIWNLTIEAESPVHHGAHGLVLMVNRGKEPFALKVAWPDEVTTMEYRSLMAWEGRSMVKLESAIPGSGIALLERLDHRRPLSLLPIDEAIPIAGDIIRQLAIETSADLPMMTDRASSIASGLAARWDMFGRPFPEVTLDQTVGLARELAQGTKRLLANWDLHYDNIIAGERFPWIAVDPMPMIGDPELGLAQLFWTRCEEISGPAHLQHLLATLIERADLDRDLVDAWMRVRLVDYWLWGIGVGLTIDPERCRTLLAWLDV